MLAIAAACVAMLMLARQADDTTLDYAVGIVPALVPWAAAWLSIGTAVWWLGGRGSSSAAGSLLLGGLLLVTAWSVVMLPFDALRLVGLVPLPLSEWGAGTRVVLLIAGAAALVPALQDRACAGAITATVSMIAAIHTARTRRALGCRLGTSARRRVI